MSTKLKKTLGIGLAAGALLLPLGIAVAQDEPTPPASPAPQELMSEEGRQDVVAGYESALAVCQELSPAELEKSPCERVLDGNMLGAPSNQPSGD